METTSILTLIQTVGFPIAMCGAMAWYVKYTEDQHREDRNGQNDRHAREMKEISDALDNNTAALHAIERALAVLSYSNGKGGVNNEGD